MARISKRRLKNMLFSLFLILMISLVSWLQRHPGGQQAIQDVLGDATPGTYQVVEFVDGDTITVNMAGKNEKVRMIGVDTPETQHPSKPVQCFGKAASDYTKSLIGTQRVSLEADATNTNRDRYARLLRYVYLPDGRMVNAEIIKQGYGFAYVSFPFTKSEEFKQYEQEAKAQNRGLWGQCEPTLQGEQQRTNDAL